MSCEAARRRPGSPLVLRKPQDGHTRSPTIKGTTYLFCSAMVSCPPCCVHPRTGTAKAGRKDTRSGQDQGQASDLRLPDPVQRGLCCTVSAPHSTQHPTPPPRGGSCKGVGLLPVEGGAVQRVLPTDSVRRPWANNQGHSLPPSRAAGGTISGRTAAALSARMRSRGWSALARRGTSWTLCSWATP